ncbi:uncharacterized protein METZ01_LOCUS425006, partial [marine metagenome]
MAVNKLDISMMEDVGTSANQLVQRDGSGNLPAIDGSQLTDVQDYTTSTSDPVIATNPSGGVGTVWYNTTSGEGYVCTDATAGENVWTNIGDGTGNIKPNHPRQGELYGYHCGGDEGGARLNNIQKHSYTSDTDAVDTTANLTDAGYHRGSGNTCSITHGYCAGHQNDNPTGYNVDTIEKFPFASSSNATDVGNLHTAMAGVAGASTTTHGYAQGGSGPGPPYTKYNEIQRWSFSSDGDAVDVGDLTNARAYAQGTMSETYGYAHG